MDKLKLITGSHFIEVVGPSLGIDQRSIRRIVVDAAVNDAVIVFVELFGQEGLLEVVPPLMDDVIIRMKGVDNED